MRPLQREETTKVPAMRGSPVSCATPTGTQKVFREGAASSPLLCKGRALVPPGGQKKRSPE